MRVLVACEFSGRVRDAFLAHGQDALSCDLQPSRVPGPHYQGDVRDLLGEPWDLLLAFPPCTYLAASGARWWAGRQQEQAAAMAFVQRLWDSPIPRIALENPVGCLSTRWRAPTQIVQPWMFGHPEIKTTCLWLKNLPLLQPTRLTFALREQRCWRMAASRARAEKRSLTFPGIAAAMAQQWTAAALPPPAPSRRAPPDKGPGAGPAAAEDEKAGRRTQDAGQCSGYHQQPLAPVIRPNPSHINTMDAASSSTLANA